MTSGAAVDSFVALRDWHAALTNFRSDAGNALTSLELSLQHAESWLLAEQQHWRRAIPRAEDEVSRARNALLARRNEDWSGRHPDTSAQEKDLAKAQAHLRFIEERLEAVQRWMRRLPVAISDHYTGPSRALSTLLEVDFPRALTQLARQIDALARYAAIAPPPAPEPTP